MKRLTCYVAALVLFSLALLTFVLKLHRKPQYISHFEALEYGWDRPFIEPASVDDGLAAYTVGHGEPILLFPYPHAHTTEPMAQGPLAEMLSDMRRQVITFDVPGAYRSTREPAGDMDEMIRSADEALDRLDIQTPVDVVGHSMGGLAALAYAIERPTRTRRLVLVGSMSGFPAIARWGLPGSAFRIFEPDYWRIILWGVRMTTGRGDLALHKKLQNLMERTCYHDKSFFTPLEIVADDEKKGVPIRMIWSRNMFRRLSYANRLAAVQAPTLILVGRYDPEAPVACSQELQHGIEDADIVVFEQSGHFPFIEESALFRDRLDAFLNSEKRILEKNDEKNRLS